MENIIFVTFKTGYSYNNAITMKNLIAICFLFLAVFLNAQQRTEAEAAEIAARHLIKSSSSLKTPPAPSMMQCVFTAENKQNTQLNKLYYIFNAPEKKGFVVVSGDEGSARPVLGYSPENHFDPENIPDGLRYWLACITESMTAGNTATEASNNLKAEIPAAGQEALQFKASVAPLLGSIKWNQSSPYNNLCPVIDSSTGKRAVTGCVATGMAMAMKYHEWPVSGTGSNTYTSETKKINLSVNFANTTYDWANMTPTYSSSSTTTQQNAVATLMYHCGVAVNMDYAEESSASVTAMAKAMRDNFGYDRNLNMANRNYVSRQEWINLLKFEINASRPLLYSGFSTTAGHLFVCDGYDENGYFHFNWGWGGLSDGYFEITALNPGSQGIGGSAGGYNSSQSVVVGLQKPTTTSIPSYYLCLESPMTSTMATTTRTGTTTINVKNMFNKGINDMSVNIGLALYSGTNLVSLVKNYASTNLNAGYGWSNFDYNSVSIPTTVAAGNYRLYAVYKPSTESNYSIVRGKIGTANYLNVNVAASGITYSPPTETAPSLTLNSLQTTGNLYQNKSGRFSMQVTNNGPEYYSVLAVYLRSVTDESVNQLIRSEINIINGESKTIDFSEKITLAPGDYYLAAMYDPGNDATKASQVSNFGSVQTVKIATAPTGEPVLQLLSPISFANNSAVDRNNAILTAQVKNTTGYFDQNVVAFIFPETGGTSLTYIGYQNQIIDENEQKTITFGGNINLNPGRYLTLAYYRNSDNTSWVRMTPNENSQLFFTLVNGISGLNTPENIRDFSIYPNPAGNYIHFDSGEPIELLQIYAVDGKLSGSYESLNNGHINLDISHLQQGNYIVLIKTPTGHSLGRFIKQ
jgi:hypothetical protein